MKTTSKKTKRRVGPETCVLKVSPAIAKSLQNEQRKKRTCFPPMTISIARSEVELWLVQLSSLNFAAKEKLDEFDHRLLKTAILNWSSMRLKRAKKKFMKDVYLSIIRDVEGDIDPIAETAKLLQMGYTKELKTKRSEPSKVLQFPKTSKDE